MFVYKVCLWCQPTAGVLFLGHKFSVLLLARFLVSELVCFSYVWFLVLCFVIGIQKIHCECDNVVCFCTKLPQICHTFNFKNQGDWKHIYQVGLWQVSEAILLLTMALRKTDLRNEHFSSSLTVVGCQDGGVNIQVTFFLKTVQTDVHLAFLNENDVLQIKVVVSAIFCVKYPQLSYIFRCP